MSSRLLSSETIHASTVASDGRAVLISGPSGSGQVGPGAAPARSRLHARQRRSDDRPPGRRPAGRQRARRPSRASSRFAASASSRWTRSSDVPVALFVELTSEISVCRTIGRERPVLGVDLPLVSVDALTASARIQGRARSRPARAEVLTRRRCLPAVLPPRLLLVTGMSGAGKSSVLDALEDMGWDCVDNLPVSLLEQLRPRRGGEECRLVPAAVGMDVRSRGFDAASLPALIRSIQGVRGEILYLDCAGSRADAPLQRDPPPAPAGAGQAGRGRDRPGARHDRVRSGNAADSIIDTTDLTPTELREELRRRYQSDSDEPVLTIVSFGYARGVSRTADLMFDMRFLDNPHWVRGPASPDRHDQPVRDYLAQDPAWTRRWTVWKRFSPTGFPATGPPAKIM